MYIHFQALNHSIAELDGTVGPRLTQYDGTRRKILLVEIALCDDFGTTLCQDTEKSCWSEESH